MTMAILKTDNYLIGVYYIFRGLVHFYNGATWWHVGRHSPGEEVGVERKPYLDPESIGN